MNGLRFRNLDKTDFLEDNDTEFAKYVTEINRTLLAEYGGNHRTITQTDVWLITYAEAGLKRNGHVDPRFSHSLGEVGLYPLPRNIRDWNGPSAPPWNRFSSLERNVHHYLLYLGHLKNKVVKSIDGLELYLELFRPQSDLSVDGRQAKILAGVVHGYFYAGNYRDQRVPLQHLIDGYLRDERLSTMMSSTRYKHARTTIISNRERNLDRALADLRLFLRER